MSKKIFTKSDFDYLLPPELIASQPAQERTGSRLLAVSGGSLNHLQFSDLPSLLLPGDVVVVNDTKVIKARLVGTKKTGGRTEILVERIESEFVALCHVKSSRGLKEAHEVEIGAYSARLVERVEDLHRVAFDAPVAQVLDEHGHVPLPNYIQRNDTPEDEERYQTIYAREEGAIAAPTAGLHFDAELMQQIENMNIRVVPITLHIGAGTFQSLRENDLSNVSMHSERYSIPQSTRTAIDNCEGRVVAVGTTVVRTLESANATGKDRGETQLFISPGFKFCSVDTLVTNFHLPESTLIMLVCAFAGFDRVMHAYKVAVEKNYRFFSYGDAMWCEKHEI
ncbi:MAG: tRNA preQ1(34) S-adenosylmethionine ribosyltransferase-isomerase QueA [Gammaproteobacteria bacterium]|nr:tRNA preQ1(34) S-adenosylmethionine ribosyltransferase-isomerase QueA [Gammaproteobacteria bacterium]MYD80103.1 tRNA preQ1(34) S-adenosylmethionine ribosyltransferase-isomerase QueA [Gammaproteobacteria bacterium]